MKQVIVSLLLLFPIIVPLCTSCDKTKPNTQNENKAEILQDTTKLDVTAESPADYGTSDDDYWVDEENWSSDNVRDSETMEVDGLYSENLPGSWSCQLDYKTKKGGQNGVTTTWTYNRSENIILNSDFTFKQRLTTQLDMDYDVQEKYSDGGLIRTNIIHYGASAYIYGESTGSWHVEFSCLVLHVESWKINPHYRHHGGEAETKRKRLDERVVQELSPTVKQIMGDMQNIYSGEIARQIVDMPSDQLILIGLTGKENTYKRNK